MWKSRKINVFIVEVLNFWTIFLALGQGWGMMGLRNPDHILLSIVVTSRSFSFSNWSLSKVERNVISWHNNFFICYFIFLFDDHHEMNKMTTFLFDDCIENLKRIVLSTFWYFELSTLTQTSWSIWPPPPPHTSEFTRKCCKFWGSEFHFLLLRIRHHANKCEKF